jgi:hypothetical protein
MSQYRYGGKSMSLKENLTTLCENLIIFPIPLEDKEKKYTLFFNDDLTIYLKDLDPGFYAWSVICQCPKKNKEDLFIYLMKGNLLGQGTGNSVISLDEKEKFLTLSLALSYEVNYQSFKENIEDFVNYLFYWREEIIKIEKEAPLI